MAAITLTPGGALISEAALSVACGGARGLARILRSHTVTEKPQPGRPRFMARRKIPAWKRIPGNNGARLVFPVNAAHMLATNGLARLPARPQFEPAPGQIAGHTPFGMPIRALAWPEPTLPLYPYQAAVVAAFMADDGPLSAERRAAGTARACLHLGTGLGKTILMLALAAACGGPALFVCERESQREQLMDWAAELYPELRAGKYDNARVEHRRPRPDTHDIVAVIINTARVKPPAFFAGYAAVLFDEADAYCTTKGMAPFWVGAPTAVALTATVSERSDGFDKLLPLFFGRALAPDDIPGCDVAALAFQGAARVVRYAGHPEHVETAVNRAGTASAIGTIQNIYADPPRVGLVVAEICALLREDLGVGPHSETGREYPRRHNVYVFTECRARLDRLQAALEAAAPELLEAGALVVPEIEEELAAAPAAQPPADRAGTGILRGGVVGDEAARARTARVILLTYGYGRRGLSVDEMNSLLFDSPRRRGMTQILGRIERRGSDAAIIRRVVDIVDIRTALKTQSGDRRAAYRAKNYEIETVAAKWEDYPAVAAPVVAAPAVAA